MKLNDSRDFQDTESVRSGQTHVVSQPVFFPPHPDPAGMQSRSLGLPSRKKTDRQAFGTHGISGNVFTNPTASFSVLFPQELNPWSSSIEEPFRSSTVEKSEIRTKDQDQRCQSVPSVKY